RRSRRWRLAGGESDRVPESGVDVFAGAVVPPGVEVVGDGLPGREVVRQHPPTTAAAGEVEGGVDDLPPGAGTGPADLAPGLGEEVLDVVPLQVGQVARVSLSSVHLFSIEAARAAGRALARRPVRRATAPSPAHLG